MVLLDSHRQFACNNCFIASYHCLWTWWNLDLFLSPSPYKTSTVLGFKYENHCWIQFVGKCNHIFGDVVFSVSFKWVVAVLKRVCVCVTRIRSSFSFRYMYWHLKYCSYLSRCLPQWCKKSAYIVNGERKISYLCHGWHFCHCACPHTTLLVDIQTWEKN